LNFKRRTAKNMCVCGVVCGH